MKNCDILLLAQRTRGLNLARSQARYAGTDIGVLGLWYIRAGLKNRLRVMPAYHYDGPGDSPGNFLVVIPYSSPGLAGGAGSTFPRAT